MQRKSWADANCPMARSVDLIGEWGSLLILREAFGGVRRFDDFQKQIGISRNLLTTRLKKLVDGGVLERRPVHSDAKRHEYVLTDESDRAGDGRRGNCNRLNRIDALLQIRIADGFGEFGIHRPRANRRDANLAASFLPEALGNRSNRELGA